MHWPVSGRQPALQVGEQVMAQFTSHRPLGQPVDNMGTYCQHAHCDPINVDALGHCSHVHSSTIPVDKLGYYCQHAHSDPINVDSLSYCQHAHSDPINVDALGYCQHAHSGIITVDEVSTCCQHAHSNNSYLLTLWAPIINMHIRTQLYSTSFDNVGTYCQHTHPNTIPTDDVDTY